jgi:endoglucanase
MRSRPALVLIACLGAALAALDRAVSAECPRYETRAPVASLMRGFNLTAWLDGETTRRASEQDLKALRALGFTHVRLPVNGELFMPGFSHGRSAAAAAELDRALDALAKAGFAVSVDMHPGGDFGRLFAASPDLAMAELEAAWRLVIERTRGRSPSGLLYEVLNEPPADPADWARRLPELLAFMRRLAPAHTLVAEPGGPQRFDALPGVTASGDANVVYAVHFYDPMYFTHQGLTWDPASPLRLLSGVPFPAHRGDKRVERIRADLRDAGEGELATAIGESLERPWTPAAIDADMAAVEAWSEKNHRFVLVNEFGALRFQSKPADRAEWLKAVRAAAERHCLGWTHWEYRDGFGFINPDGKPDAATLKALLGP